MGFTDNRRLREQQLRAESERALKKGDVEKSFRLLIRADNLARKDGRRP